MGGDTGMQLAAQLIGAISRERLWAHPFVLRRFWLIAIYCRRGSIDHRNRRPRIRGPRAVQDIDGAGEVGAMGAQPVAVQRSTEATAARWKHPCTSARALAMSAGSATSPSTS